MIDCPRTSTYSHITLLDEKGEKLKSGRVSNLRIELENFLSGIEEVEAVVEAGRSSYTMVDLLDEIGNRCKDCPSKRSESDSQGEDKDRQAGFLDVGSSFTD